MYCGHQWIPLAFFIPGCIFHWQHVHNTLWMKYIHCLQYFENLSVMFRHIAFSDLCERRETEPKIFKIITRPLFSIIYYKFHDPFSLNAYIIIMSLLTGDYFCKITHLCTLSLGKQCCSLHVSVHSHPWSLVITSPLITPLSTNQWIVLNEPFIAVIENFVSSNIRRKLFDESTLYLFSTLLLIVLYHIIQSSCW